MRAKQLTGKHHVSPGPGADCLGVTSGEPSESEGAGLSALARARLPAASKLTRRNHIPASSRAAPQLPARASPALRCRQLSCKPNAKLSRVEQMRAYKILYLLASWLLVRPTSASWPAGTYELRFQNDELDNSTIIKRPLQPLVLRCQVKLVHKFARQDELASEKNASQLVIDWLKDELPLAGEQVNVISVELAAGSKSANSRPLAKPGAQKGRIEIKNTLNPNQLKLSSRLKLNRLRTGDSGRYRCRARATLGPAGELSADSSGSQLLVSSSRVAGKYWVLQGYRFSMALDRP